MERRTSIRSVRLIATHPIDRSVRYSRFLSDNVSARKRNGLSAFSEALPKRRKRGSEIDVNGSKCRSVRLLGLGALMVGLVLGTATTLSSASADGPVPTQDVVEQYVGQGVDPGLTEAAYQPNAGQQGLANLVGMLAGKVGSTQPGTDPDPTLPLAIQTIVTNEEVTTPADVLAESAHDTVLSALDVPQVIQAHSSLPETSQDVPGGTCPSGVFGTLCRVFN